MKIIDQIYRCQIPGQVFGIWHLQCHLRIFQTYPGIQTVMITDMGFEFGWFIPYLVEKLIEQIVAEFHLNPRQLLWVEHYTPNCCQPTCADFSQVTFEWHDGQALNPQWTSISCELIEELTSPEAPDAHVLTRSVSSS